MMHILKGPFRPDNQVESRGGVGLLLVEFNHKVFEQGVELWLPLIDLFVILNAPILKFVFSYHKTTVIA